MLQKGGAKGRTITNGLFFYSRIKLMLGQMVDEENLKYYYSLAIKI